MNKNRKTGLFVVSAPSGGGKTTLCRRLLSELQGIAYSISCTTRSPRAGEKNGADYFFLTENEFSKKKERGDFLESAKVHGYQYGTPKQSVIDTLRSGTDVLMDIDVQGAGKIRQIVEQKENTELRDAFVDIFIVPPDIETLKKRLISRGKDDSTTIERRMNNALTEMKESGVYKYLIVNDKLDEAYDFLRSIVLAERCRQA